MNTIWCLYFAVLFGLESFLMMTESEISARNVSLSLAVINSVIAATFLIALPIEFANTGTPEDWVAFSLLIVCLLTSAIIASYETHYRLKTVPIAPLPDTKRKLYEDLIKDLQILDQKLGEGHFGQVRILIFCFLLNLSSFFSRF